MRGRSQTGLRRRQLLREQLLAGRDVEELETHSEPARRGLELSNHQVIGLEQAPVLEADLIATHWSRDHLGAGHGCKSAAPLQVRPHDRGDVGGPAFGLASERHDRDGHRIAHTLGDVEAQLRMTGGRCDAQQRGQHVDPVGRAPGPLDAR